MSSYIIAGSSEKVDFAECENMSNLIKTYYPDISFKIVLKEQSQWEQYVDEICRIYGFKQKSNPIVYTIDGKLIGDRNVLIINMKAFISLAETRFGVVNPKLRQGPITADINKRVSKQEYDQKVKLLTGTLTLSEKLEQQMLQLYTKGVVKCTDGVFISGFSGGLSFYYKQEKWLTPELKVADKLEVLDEVEVIEEDNNVMMEEKVDGHKVIRSVPMFAERFLTIEQQQHLLKQLQEQQQRDRENASKGHSVIDAKEVPDVTQILSPRAKDANVIAIPEEEDNQEYQNQQDEAPIDVIPEFNNNAESIYNGNDPIEEIKEDEISPAKKRITEYIIDTLENDYVLILHPHPLIDGHMLLAKLEDDSVWDYSCIKRGRINTYKKSTSSVQGEGLYESCMDIHRSITIQDCQVLVPLIEESDAIAVLNILPQDLISFLPLSNGHYNLILRQHAHIAQNRNKLFEHLLNPKPPLNGKQLMPLEEYLLTKRSSSYEITKDIYKVKDLPLMHCLSFPGKLTPENLQDTIVRMIVYQLDKEHNNALKMGYNLVISKHIVFLCPTFTNYDTINNTKVHLSAFATLGFLNLPLNSPCLDIFALLQKAQQDRPL